MEVSIEQNGNTRQTDEAILQALVYADLFDQPLALDEIHRYLPHIKLPLERVERCLAESRWLRQRVEASSPFWHLAGRRSLVALRHERAAYAKRLWPVAWRYCRFVALLPYVRMVAVTGSLAANNPMSERDDIDLFIVTAPGRLWLSRGMAILVVRLAWRAGIELCPNYLIAEPDLALESRSLFTAHELVQMVPLYGPQAHNRLLASNRWVASYLPNAFPIGNKARRLASLPRQAQRQGEFLLNTGLGARLERWERNRKIPRLRRRAAEYGGSEAVFSARLCKGHIDDHQGLVENRLAERLERHLLSYKSGTDPR